MRTSSCLIFFTLSLFSKLANASWEQEQTALNMSVLHDSNKQESESNYMSKVQLSLDSTKLFQGVGVKVNGSLAANSLSDNDYATEDDFSYGLTSRIFLSDSSNAEISADENRRIGLIDQKSSVYLDANSQFQKSSGSAKAVKVRLGSDQQVRSIAFGYTESESSIFSGDHLLALRSDEARFYDVRFQNKVTEDTFLVLKVERSEINKLSESNESNTRVQNGFIGFKTRYLGASSIEVLLGISETDNFGHGGSLDNFSWKLNNELRLSDYFNITLSAQNAFQDSNDLQFQSNDVKTMEVKAEYLPTNYFAVSLRAFGLQRNLNDIERVTEEGVALSTGFKIVKNWSVSTSLNWLEQDDTRDEFDFDELKLAVGLKWQVY
mgnify:CR=1 FL=1